MYKARAYLTLAFVLFKTCINCYTHNNCITQSLR